MISYSPLKLDSSIESLKAISGVLTGFSANELYGPCWLMGVSGVHAIYALPHRLERAWEASTLSISPLEKVREQSSVWAPPNYMLAAPEPLRTVVVNGPTRPEPPKEPELWPFMNWRTEVLQRTSYTIEVDDPHAPDGLSDFRGYSRPDSIPTWARSTCDCDAGLLFTGDEGRRLLIGLDYRPANLLVSSNDAVIDDYIHYCTNLDLREYLRSLEEMVEA